MKPADVTEYPSWRTHALLIITRELATANIKIAQKTYKHQYDKCVVPTNFKVGDLVLVKFHTKRVEETESSPGHSIDPIGLFNMMTQMW